MEKDKNKIAVVFKVEDGGSIVAVFPTEEYDYSGYTVNCYSHVGQHSGCNIEYAKGLKNATPEQYADLKKELESLGYNLVDVNAIMLSCEEKKTGMELSRADAEKYFYNALCNAVGTGYMDSYGITMKVDKAAYSDAAAKLNSQPHSRPCYEDVLMQVLRDGGKLTFRDIEGDGANTKSVTMKEVHERVGKTPLRHLTDMIEENDDVTTADVILQTVFFEDIIFG